MTTETLQHISPWLGVFGSFLLAWRLVGTWDHLNRLTRALGVTLAVVVVVGAYGGQKAVQANLNISDDVILAVFLARLLVVAVALAWPWRD